MKKYTTTYPFIQADVITKNGSIYPKSLLKNIIGQKVPVSVGFDYKKSPIGEGVVNSDITVTIDVDTKLDLTNMVIVPSGFADRKWINNETYELKNYKLKGMHVIPKEQSCWRYNK